MITDVEAKRFTKAISDPDAMPSSVCHVDPGEALDRRQRRWL